MNIKQELLKARNFRAGRRREIDMIVDHASEGDAASVRSWFNAEVSDVSSHYFVLKNGDVIQFVEDADEAWHAGRVDNPTAPLVLERPGVNPNSYSIGIEHENNGNEPLTPKQLAATVELHQHLSVLHNIPLDARHVVGHHAVYSKKMCPGKIDVAEIIRLAAAAPGVVTSRPPAPQVVWSDFFHDWLIVVRVVSDSEWYFVTTKMVGAGAQRAQTPLSQMVRA